MEFTRKGKVYRIDGKNVDFLAAIDESGIGRAYEYAEPGYTVPKDHVAALFGNWNTGNSGLDLCMALAIGPENEEALLKFLDREFILEWNDEWTYCTECGKPVRTEGDSYSWTPSWVVRDNCGFICLHCIDFDDVLPDYIDNPNKAWNFEIVRLYGAGFNPLPDSWHGGIREFSVDPRKVYAEIKEKNPENSYIFRITDVEQFGVNFEIWEKEGGR